MYGLCLTDVLSSASTFEYYHWRMEDSHQQKHAYTMYIHVLDGYYEYMSNVIF